MTPSVFCLRETCIPLAVGGCVIAVVVDALDGQAFWSWPHIGEEIFKLVPSFANCNTAATIVFEVFKIFVVATLHHGVPGCVCSRPCAVADMPVSEVIALLLEATTRACRSCRQVAGGYFMEVSSVARSRRSLTRRSC